MPTRPDDLTDVRDVLHSTAKDGEVRVNFGDAASGEGERGDVQVWGVDGYHARPNDPDGDGACQAFYIVDGQQQRVIATRDNRNAKAAGELEPGDRVIGTKGPPRFFLKQKTQRIGLYTEAKQTPPVGGKGQLLDLNGDDGTITIRCGGCTILLDGQNGKIVLTATGPAGAATLTLDSVKGAAITAGVANIDAPFVTLGLTGGTLRPGIPGVDSICYGALGTSAVASSSCFVAK
jgi:hypothetical protein